MRSARDRACTLSSSRHGAALDRVHRSRDVSSMKLYGFPMSPNTQRARFGLEEAGIDYEFVRVDLMSGEHRAPAYLAINPAGRVPALVDDDFTLFESNAILEYAAALAPQKRLGPENPRERAELSRWMFFGTAHVGPHVQAIFAHTIRLPPEKRLPALVETARAELARSLHVLDARLAKREWLAADRFTIADCSIAPTLSAAPMLQIDLSPFTHLSAWLGRVGARAAWGKATAM